MPPALPPPATSPTQDPQRKPPGENGKRERKRPPGTGAEKIYSKPFKLPALTGFHVLPCDLAREHSCAPAHHGA